MSVVQFIEVLRGRPSSETVANPYNCYLADIDADAGASEARRNQLRAYLEQRTATARFIFIAEAPGYQGARFSGIAMTSERMLLGGSRTVSEPHIVGRANVSRRTSHPNACRYRSERRSGFNEPTATIVWKEIMRRRLAAQIVLWNTFPFHPHHVGSPLANRTPTLTEVHQERDILRSFLGLFVHELQILAIGRVARDHLSAQGTIAEHVRHPANGGAREFRIGIGRFLDRFD